MPSLLIITPVTQLQNKVTKIVEKHQEVPVIYVSLNKTQKSIATIFKSKSIKLDKVFFIDCVTSEKTTEDVLHFSPHQLELVSAAVNEFIKTIKGKKALIIDALSTLLIYNDENRVARFVKKITEYASDPNVEVIAVSPKTKGEELLNKIFNFFDKVEGK